MTQFLTKIRIPLVLAVFSLVFASMTVSSFVQKSSIWDESIHLVAGYVMAKDHDYRVSHDHLPFQRLLAACPLLLMRDVAIYAEDILGPASAEQPRDPNRIFFTIHDAMYKTNNADRLLYPARFMSVLLGILLGILVFCWANELWGFWPATGVLAVYAFEPNILAHSSLVTTDFGITCFFFGTIYFLWRLTRSLTVLNFVGFAAFFTLAQISKFSALLLLPIAVGLLLIRAFRSTPWPCRIGLGKVLSKRGSRTICAMATILTLGLVTYTGVWAAYSFRYRPSPYSSETITCDQNERLAQRFGNWVDRHHLLPNAYIQGFIGGNKVVQGHGAYIHGKYSVTGWWYYFPVAFLVKTPAAVILLFAAGLALCIFHWRRFWEDWLFILLPVFLFMGVAMTTTYNIGLRHILPIYPFVILLTGLCIAELWNARPLPRSIDAGEHQSTPPGTIGGETGKAAGRAIFGRGRKIMAAVFVGLVVLESALVYPDYLAFFNVFAGGPSNGDKWLVDSNLDWGQDLKGLKRWMDKRSVNHINLCYFGTADPAYYGINCTYLPGSEPFYRQNLIQGPKLPGYVAISATNLRGVYFSEAGRALYRPFLDMQPVTVIGHSIKVYWVANQWW